MTRVPDGCLVPTEPLAHVLSGWFHEWNEARPQTAGRFVSPGTHSVSPVRATSWLSETSGVPEGTIQRIVQQRSTGTELRIADALVSAIERTDLFYDGEPPTLPVYPNPSARREDRAECCGGSDQWSLLGTPVAAVPPVGQLSLIGALGW